jgi:hypothetical protein
MMKRFTSVLILITLVLITSAPLAAAAAPPGATGWLTINCNIDGASVYLDNTLKGTVSGGSFDIADGNLYSTYAVKKDGYYDVTGDISFLPGGSGNLEITADLTPKPTGSGKGWIAVHANVDGASVAFDGITKGTTTDGVFTLEVATTGSPYSTFTVSKSGYVTYEGSVGGMPADGATKDLSVTLAMIPVTAPTTVPSTVPTTVPTTIGTPIGGDAGWYQVSCNVNGATVSFDSVSKGAIANGVLSVPVYSTGTPYKTYRVEKAGYVTATGSLPAAPAKGQSVPVHVTLVPVTTAVTTAPTAPVNPPGSEHGWIAIHANVDGAIVTVGSTTVGTIRNGVLTIPVATTGTPYSAFTVSKTGYATTTGTVPRQPAAGETVDIYVTLTAVQPTDIPTTQSPLSPFAIVAGLAGCVMLAGFRKAKIS